MMASIQQCYHTGAREISGMLEFQKINQFEGFETNKVFTLSATAVTKEFFWQQALCGQRKIGI